MSLNLELSEEEALCLHRYFERVDETEDLSFCHPAEYLAFQRIAGQVVRAGTALLKSRCETALDMARHSVARSFAVGPPANDARIARPPVVVSMAPRVPPERRLPSRVPDAHASRAEAIVRECIGCFEARDVERTDRLFAVDARIVSPHFGCSTARAFLSRVARTPAAARMTLHGVFTNIEGRPQATGYFLYDGWHGRANCGGHDERHGVFNYVLNVDPGVTRIQSMIIL